MDVCEVQSNATESPWIATVLVDKKPVNFKLDSGADVTVVPYNTFLNIDVKIQLKPIDKVPLGPCNYRMNCKREFSHSRLQPKFHKGNRICHRKLSTTTSE